ncbi:MAG: ABC transporter ATP-binding protein [Peptoniphilaceae bacterium]|nr:ABC transporter ATP-binding protein [Peptoniphilaceae bacterium]MDY6085337.1 ABC transporter ATP-binding protein [Peptoniphilaceae bacterium]
MSEATKTKGTPRGEVQAMRAGAEAEGVTAATASAPAGAAGADTASPAQGTPLLRVNQLNVYYGAIHAITDITFDVYKGEIVTLIGANGAGKTTTLQTISGLLPAKSGSIRFREKELTTQPAYKIVEDGIAQSPEGRRVFERMSVMENLEMGAYHIKDDDAIAQSFDKVYSLFPRLYERKSQDAGTLSGGEQQMLAIGRALMAEPELLMLDEPSMGLAPIIVSHIFDIIQRLHDEGTTILLVEQNARAALSIADRCYVMETGRIVMTGTGKDLLNAPEIKKTYLGG